MATEPTKQSESKDSKESERKPVVLSKDEAIYPPSSRALKITIALIIVAIILAIVGFITIPLD